MAKRVALARYWPALLFLVSNLAAVVLVVKANNNYDSPPPMVAQAESNPTDGFVPLDSVDPTATGGNYTPLVFDWGNEFDVDAPPAGQPSATRSLFGAATEKLARLRRQARGLELADARAGREGDLLREPLRVNYFNREGEFIGRQNFLPPAGFSLPPLSPVAPLQMRAAGQDIAVYGGADRTLNVQVDPALFKDPEAMTTFVTNLTEAMVTAGIRPQVQIGRAANQVLGAPGGVRPLPPALNNPRVASSVSPNTPLPAPPADVLRGVVPPKFRRDLGTANGQQTIGDAPPVPLVTDGPPLSLPPITAAPEDRPVAAPPAAVSSPPSEATPRPSTPAVELSGSEAATDSTPRSARPPARPEPRVSIRVQLSRFPDRSAAERALARLRGAGLGGIMTRDSSSGPDFWVVYTRTFSTRSEANRALAEVRSMGYEAWQS